MKTAAVSSLLLLLPPGLLHGALASAATESHLEQDVQDMHALIQQLQDKVASARERRLALTDATFTAAESRILENVGYITGNLTATTAAQEAGDAELGAAMDSCWLLLCGSLVFFMHTGFGMLESGCCRSKNASNVLLKNLMNVTVGTIAWYVSGWAFAYGGPDEDGDGMLDNGFIGTSQFFAGGFMEADETTGIVTPYAEVGQSAMLGWFFQWAFCTAAATIVSGGVAERVKAPTYACYAFVMAGFIYPGSSPGPGATAGSRGLSTSASWTSPGAAWCTSRAERSRSPARSSWGLAPAASSARRSSSRTTCRSWCSGRWRCGSAGTASTAAPPSG